MNEITSEMVWYAVHEDLEYETRKPEDEYDYILFLEGEELLDCEAIANKLNAWLETGLPEQYRKKEEKT